MISIPELGDDVHAMWTELIRLAGSAPAPWVLIGAHMVALHGWARGRDQIRPSKDGDILVDVRAVTDATARMSEALLDLDFDLDGISPDGIGHRFVRGALRLDVLAPDGLGERANVRTTAGARTVRVPGGSQALRRRQTVDITTRGHGGSIPIPNLLGALLVKIRAIEVADEPQAQRRDVGFLLSLVEDPDTIAQEMSASERGWLRRHSYLADPGDNSYSGIVEARDAAIVFRRLSGVG
jgi:hypothetical protein